jgi:hypothetical protein
MKAVDTKEFHKFYGDKKLRITYQNSDFLDYVAMLSMSASLIGFVYGAIHPLSIVSYVLCAFMLALFPMRHGVQFRVPLILARPQEVLYCLIHKIQNIKPVYFIAIGALLLENYIISLTPEWPHKVQLMHQVAHCSGRLRP